MLKKKAKLLLKLQSRGVFPEQKTHLWYTTKHNMLSASECATALEYNIYQTSGNLFKEKIKPF